MDATIGAKELGLTYKKSEFAHCGCPEKLYGSSAELLIEKGYKVGRIEKTVTMEKRRKKIPKPSKHDRMIMRALCQITTKGTRTYSFLEAEPHNEKNQFLLALTENVGDARFTKATFS